MDWVEITENLDIHKLLLGRESFALSKFGLAFNFEGVNESSIEDYVGEWCYLGAHSNDDSVIGIRVYLTEESNKYISAFEQLENIRFISNASKNEFDFTISGVSDRESLGYPFNPIYFMEGLFLFS